jgi:hypothetical protein
MPKTVRPSHKGRRRATEEGRQLTAKARASAIEKKKAEAQEEHLHIYGQILARVPNHRITKRDGTPASAWLRREAMRHIETQIRELTTEENLLVAIEAEKEGIQELKQRLEVFKQDEEAEIVQQGSNGQLERKERRPNRAAEVGLRKLIAQREERLQELQGLLEVHKSNSLITLDVNGVMLIHRIIMSLVAEFLPRTEDQLSFRKRLSEILKQLSNGLLVGQGRLPDSEALNGILDVGAGGSRNPCCNDSQFWSRSVPGPSV